MQFLKKVYHYFAEYSLSHYWRWHEAYLRGGVVKYWYLFRMRRFERTAQAEIPHTKKINRFYIPHGLSGIFISQGAAIGTGCTIFQQVTVGSNMMRGSRGYGFPTVGNNVYIGAGAKIIGNVHIGDNVRIGANCVVTCDVPDNCTVVCESPRIIQKTMPQDNTFQPYMAD